MPDAGADAVGRELELRVGAVAHGGFCVARDEGRVVFVRHALPGERVRARVTEVGPRGRYLRADAVEVLESSPDRVDPPCHYARPGGCGGCDWQHASLPAQRALKAAVVAEQLRRIAGVEWAVTVEALRGSAGGGTSAGTSEGTGEGTREGTAGGDGLGWRTRVQFAVDAEGRPGLRRYRSHQVQPLEACLIAHPDIEALGVEGSRWPGVDRVEAAVATGTGEHAVLAGRDKVRPTLVAGREVVHEQVAGRRWRVSAGGFWQVHPAAAGVLSDAVVAALDPRPGEHVLDLYCGVGLFAGALAPRVDPGRVTAVESDRRAVADARANLADLPTVRVERGPVEGLLRRLDLRGTALVVLDPPRAGAGRAVVDLLAALDARRLVYVACDPAALARDVGYFAAHGYRLSALRAFDLFPMTHHVECVATLER